MKGICSAVIVATLAAPVRAADAVSQLPGYDAGGAAAVPAPAPAPELMEDPSSPTASFDFLVRTEAGHAQGAVLFSPFRQSEEKGAGPSPSQSIPYFDIARAEAAAQGVDLALVLAVIQKESSFDPKARSSVGAVGLMQLMPATARWLGLKDTRQLTKPEVNIKYGVKYLKYLWDEFASMPAGDLSQADLRDRTARMAIAAYNAGQGNVRKYNDVPPFKETRNYVERVSEYFAEYDELIAESAA